MIAVVATWISYYGWSDTSWRTIEALAVTDAEMAEAASDTDAVFEPIFFGTLFAVVYPLVWLLISLTAPPLFNKFRRNKNPVETPTPNIPVEKGG